MWSERRIDIPFQPDSAGTTRQQVEMAQDGSSSVLAFIQEFIQEQVDSGAERIKRKISDVLGKVESGKRKRECQMREGGLRRPFASV
jgi:hypothetical protein